MGDNYNSDSESKKLAYDLRQTYALIVGDICRGIASARQSRDYKAWFYLLDDLHTEVAQKLNKDEKKEYYEELKKTTEVIKRYPTFMTGLFSQNRDMTSELYFALKKLEMWIKSKMEEHDMYGSDYEYDGL